MKFAKSILTGAGAVVLAGLILALLAPRAAHAIVATAVQVENTRSTPVPNQDVDIAARHPYMATCMGELLNATPGFATCQPFPAPPATGYETVIQSVNMSVQQSPFGSPSQPYLMQLSYATANNSFQDFIPFTLQSQFGSLLWVGSQLTAIYLDPGPSSPLLCQASIPAGSGVSLQCTVTGYTVALP